MIPDPEIRRRLMRRRMRLLGVLLVVLLVMGVVQIIWPYAFAGTALWVSSEGAGSARVYSGENEHHELGRPLTVYWRPAGSWRWIKLDTQVPPDAAGLQYHLEPGLLRISFHQDDRLGDTLLVLRSR